jgi:hypothetical protein
MVTRITQTAIAAVLAMATVGMTGNAMAEVEHFDTDKATFETKAEPAAEVIRQDGRQVVTAPTEKANQPACDSPAMEASDAPGTQTVVKPPKREKCQ